MLTLLLYIGIMITYLKFFLNNPIHVMASGLNCHCFSKEAGQMPYAKKPCALGYATQDRQNSTCLLIHDWFTSRHP